MKKPKKVFFIVITLMLLFAFVQPFSVSIISYASENKMPFYRLKPSEIVCRARFYTTYASSTSERKNNVKLAASSINNTFVDVGGEFSFNATVGLRTEKRGYQKAKIIVGGEFVDGVGGGVCQVSTTLYNAVLLAGLEITEYHPHSLPVGYVAPSFDAMVNSGSSDLRFVNNTYNPIIIKALADGNTLTIEIYGEKMNEKIVRRSVIVELIPAPPEQEEIDINGDYPELFEGERKVLKYSHAGYKSEGYIERVKDGKVIESKKIRTDKYSASRGIAIIGVNPRPIEDVPEIVDGESLIN